VNFNSYNRLICHGKLTEAYLSPPAAGFGSTGVLQKSGFSGTLNMLPRINPERFRDGVLTVLCGEALLAKKSLPLGSEIPDERKARKS
jgi:hypothetical protein